LQPSCVVLVQDKKYGINPSTVACEYSQDEGRTWHPWTASCSGNMGTKGVETITAADIPFTKSALLQKPNYVRFVIVNANGDTMSSSAFAIFNGHPPDYQAEIVLGLHADENGVQQRYNQNDDGWSAATTIGGVACVYNLVANPSPYPGRYLYFDVADSLVYAGSHPEAWISIDYYDTSATGRIELQYDSHGNELAQKYKSGGSVHPANSRTWKTAVFHLSDAYFGNRQNGKSDFRFYTDGVMFIRRVRVSSFDLTGVQEGLRHEHPPTLAKYALLQNYPNPFNQKTKIRYQLSHTTPVQLMIYDINGRRVRTLVNEEKTAGNYLCEWDASSEAGIVSSGVYLALLSANGQRLVRRLVLLK